MSQSYKRLFYCIADRAAKLRLDTIAESELEAIEKFLATRSDSWDNCRYYGFECVMLVTKYTAAAEVEYDY